MTGTKEKTGTKGIATVETTGRKLYGNDFGCKARPARYFEIGAHLAPMLDLLGILPHNRATAIATFRVAIMGRNRHDHDGISQRTPDDFNLAGRWCHSRMQSYRGLPSHRWRCSGPTSAWVTSDSFDGANDVLRCFGITVNDVLARYGNVGDDDRQVHDLIEIISALRPDLVADVALKEALSIANVA